MVIVICALLVELPDRQGIATSLHADLVPEPITLPYTRSEDIRPTSLVERYRPVQISGVGSNDGP